jgi:hypothetical protein
VHDSVFFEINGKPAITIATNQFADAAAAQARGLGLPELECVFVEHPVADAEDDEIRAKADRIVDRVAAALGEQTGSQTKR